MYMLLDFVLNSLLNHKVAPISVGLIDEKIESDTINIFEDIHVSLKNVESFGSSWIILNDEVN